jgi:hypothetical protein
MKQSLVLGMSVLLTLFCCKASGQQSVTLGWDPVTNSSIAGYIIVYGTASQKYTVTNDVGTNTSVTLTNLQFNTNYYFAVASYAPGGVQSTLSPEVEFTSAPTEFFASELGVANDEEYLEFPDGTPFGYFTYSGFPFIDHEDMGYEYFINANDGQGGAYLFDFQSNGFWYTSPTLFPYIFDFNSNAWLYYYPDSSQAGHYTTNPRLFFNYNTGEVISE